MIQLKEVADNLNVTPNAVVLAWMMQSLPQIITLITGSSVSQVQENLKALSVELSTKHMIQLNQDIF
jgi:aryl-alcohol dehydrogenase-like predicted oxidoreductase